MICFPPIWYGVVQGRFIHFNRHMACGKVVLWLSSVGARLSKILDYSDQLVKDNAWKET